MPATPVVINIQKGKVQNAEGGWEPGPAGPVQARRAFDDEQRGRGILLRVRWEDRGKGKLPDDQLPVFTDPNLNRKLNELQIRILLLLKDGNTLRATARALNRQNIGQHVDDILRLLDSPNFAQAIEKAERLGLLEFEKKLPVYDPRKVPKDL